MHIYICTAVSNLMPQESHQKKSISLKYKFFFLPVLEREWKRAIHITCMQQRAGAESKPAC